MDVETPTTPAVVLISGKPFTDIPADLFIPPDALEVFLDSFTGPLDLLLYLIRRQNIDILNIPVAHITQQYMQYISILEEHRLELAADYLVMAAMLAEIKSRLLLPPAHNSTDEIEEDPRLLLVRKLQAYEQFKQAARNLDELPRCERDIFRFSMPSQGLESIIIHPDVSFSMITLAMQWVVERQGHLIHHQIKREPLSVKERMAMVLEQLQEKKSISMSQLLKREEGRGGLTVTFLAILELARLSLLILNQTAAFMPIYLHVIHHE